MHGPSLVEPIASYRFRCLSPLFCIAWRRLDSRAVEAAVSASLPFSLSTSLPTHSAGLETLFSFEQRSLGNIHRWLRIVGLYLFWSVLVGSLRPSVYTIEGGLRTTGCRCCHGYLDSFPKLPEHVGTITLHWFWCSCVGRQKHFHCRRQTLPMHGSVDQDAELESTPDFDSSQAESSSQLAPNVTVGAKQFRYTEVSFQPGYRCNMKSVVYIRKELCNMSCCHVARPCSNGSISARRRVLVCYFPSPGRTTGLTMDSRDDVLHTALIYDGSRSASQCASCQPDFFDLVILGHGWFQEAAIETPVSQVLANHDLLTACRNRHSQLEELFSVGHDVTVSASGRHFFLVSCSFAKQVLMQLDLSKYWKESAACLPLAETAR